MSVKALCFTLRVFVMRLAANEPSTGVASMPCVSIVPSRLTELSAAYGVLTAVQRNGLPEPGAAKTPDTCSVASSSLIWNAATGGGGRQSSIEADANALVIPDVGSTISGTGLGRGCAAAVTLRS